MNPFRARTGSKAEGWGLKRSQPLLSSLEEVAAQHSETGHPKERIRSEKFVFGVETLFSPLPPV
jgi:hypothetical protein